jgi:hypothetical protein
MPFVLPTHFEDDVFLPADIALEKYRQEKIEPQLQSYRLWDHESFKDFSRRKGEVLHSSRFIHRLRTLEPRFIIQQQINFPDDWGLYVQRGNRLIHICPITKGWLTEFSYTTVDRDNLPSDPCWGWRTVLVRCMGNGVLTWDMVVKEFGNSTNANSERWQMYTAPFRNRHSRGVVHRNLKNHFEEF